MSELAAGEASTALDNFVSPEVSCLISEYNFDSPALTSFTFDVSLVVVTVVL